MGVRIGDDATVTVEFDDYYGHAVTVVCKVPSTREHDAFQNAYMSLKGGKLVTNTTAAHREVVKLVNRIDGVDMPDGRGAWRAVTAVGPEEAQYLIDKHGRLLRALSDHLFGATSSAVKDGDGPLE